MYNKRFSPIEKGIKMNNKVYIHLAKGFEEIEALTITDVLRRGGVAAETVSITGNKPVRGTHGVNIEADILFEEANYEGCRMIVLPGGMPGAANLGEHEGLCTKIKEFAADSEKYLAAICAAPMVFAACGVLEGEKATIYPGMESKLAGSEATGENVTVSGRTVTGLGPATAMEFALKLLDVLEGREKRDEVASGLLFDRR